MHRSIRSFSIAYLIGCLFLVACSPSETGRRQAVGDSSVVESEWGIRGVTNETTEPFEMPSGVTEISFTHQGSSAYSITLLNEDSKPVQQIAAGSGNASATKQIEVLTPGKYRLQIVADAAWEITMHYSDDGLL